MSTLDPGRVLFEQHFRAVPRGTALKLERYAAMLAAWNTKFNLVAASTLPHLWQRHILDCAQLYPLLPKNPKTLVADMGSGAGFPGIVLAILSGLETHLIESTGKKALFLKTVAEELELNVRIHQERVEAMTRLKADVITARALKSLPELFTYAKPLMKKDSLCLFLKGQKADEEIAEAVKKWSFVVEKTPSLSDETGCILRISQLDARRSGPAPKHAKTRR